MRKQTILYITYRPTRIYPASSVNAADRMAMLEQIGYRVIPFFSGSSALNTWRSLLGVAGRADSICIRIDGSGVLDLYTLIKIFFPRVRIIWEIHGPVGESQGNDSWFAIATKSGMRRILSWLTNGYLFVSQPLHVHMRGRLAPKKSFVVPNTIGRLPSPFIKKDLLKRIRNKLASFVVFWGGDPQYSWQAIDLVAAAAKTMESINPHILFVVIAEGSWYPLRQKDNLLLLPKVDRTTYRGFISRADICLALYHKPERAPFYFAPLKLLEYMLLKKPVIVTRQRVFEPLIKNNINGVFTDNTVGDIVEKILFLQKDTPFRRRLGESAYRTGLQERLRIQKLYRQAMLVLLRRE